MTTIASNTGLTLKKATKPRGVAKRNNLNLRNLPTRVSGFPESLYTKYAVEIVITGPNQMVQRLRALDEEGNPGKYVQLEDALRLCRAAGFVKACDKEVTRSEDTEKTRMMFFQTQFDPKKVRDPKAFTKTILTYEENLNKTRLALDRAGDTPEDTNAKAFLTKQLNSAEGVLKEFIRRRADGKKCTIREVAYDLEMPASMVSKTLTGTIEVPPNGHLWTTLVGRELDKFCNLTLKEIANFKEKTLLFYMPEEMVKAYRVLCTPEAQKAAFGTTKDLTEKQHEKYLEQPVPIHPLVGVQAMLKRSETTKASIRKRQTANALFPKIIEVTNKVLDKFFICPPAEVSKVHEYWSNLCGQNLNEPDLVSSSYRTQALEALENDDGGLTNPIKSTPIAWKEFRWEGAPLHAYSMKMTASHIRSKGLEEYNPPEIVGPIRKPKRRERLRANAVRKNDLTKKSKRYVKALVDSGVPTETVKSVIDFLESFLYLEMQDLASHIVYLTCRLTLYQARSAFLDEEDENDDGSYTEESDTEEKEEEEALEPPMEPTTAPAADEK